jgi:uncharacterized protein (TIGR00369 family)
MKHTFTMEEMQDCINLSPFNRWLDLTIHRMTETSVTLHLPMRPDMEGNVDLGVLHGGIMATIIDAAGSYAIIAHNNHTNATIDLHIDYLLPVTGPCVYVSTEILRMGRRIAIVDMRVHDHEGRLVSAGRGKYLHSPRKPKQEA